ncbi:nucleotide exchange factor GrpE [bacterium SCSIO 12643]|nr:nucleotide exchange factor GrpE [bacterium SCSIO 12643]
MTENKKDINEEIEETPVTDQETVQEEGAQNSEESAEAKAEEKEEPAKPTIEEELEMYKDKHLRMYSEFENFRRRSAKERIELMQNAGQEIITALLPILDDFDRAKAANENSEDLEAIKEGMELIYNKIFTLLGQKGLKPMEAQGKDFNSDDYEAIAKIPAPTEDLKGKVIDVTEKGYYLNNKIIRHAKVVVGE